MTAAGRLYSETEFDLSGLAPLRDQIVETGRLVRAPQHRSGAVINLMDRHRPLPAPARSALARRVRLRAARGRWRDGRLCVWEVVRERHISPPRLRVTPHHPYVFGPPPSTKRAELVAAVPPLLRGYLRPGAWVR